VLVAAQVIGGVGNGAGLAVGALLVKDITDSSGWSGLAVVMLTLGAAAFTVPLSRLAIASGRRPALTAGWLVGATGAALVAASAHYESLVLALVGLFGFGASTAANLQSRFAATDRAPAGAVGRSLSLVVWSTTIGAVAGPNLTGPGARLADSVGLPDLAGPMLFSVAAFALAGVLTWLWLRPDPLEGQTTKREPGKRGASAWSHVRGATATAVMVIATSHAVMVAVMALTPVHMEDHGAHLTAIGLTISLHIAGMFALSPIMGWLADRWGPDPTILAGQVTLIAAVAVSGTSGDSHVQITIGLTLLGIGWSASVIAGAAKLTRSTDPDLRPAVQGASDLAMNLAGAAGGLLAGVVVAQAGFGTLNVFAAVMTLPVMAVVLAGRRVASQMADGR
jgi:MFS family permease